VLTPIAWWGAGHGTAKTAGFSDRYEMRQMTTDRQAWAAQARFLKQFAEHVNRFTGRRYADDPVVLAFECINEPLYPEGTPDSLVTAYINALADALRASGTEKPIYYNSWAGRNAAAGAARIDGVTGSNYPTGLASGRALKGPRLLRARGSSLRPDAAIATKSRMIYEFDAADVPGSHMYPSIAKFFRSEGVQVAAQFQYDPLPLAAVNRNWMTHHLNVVYTPGKAISLAIAAEVFRRVPRGVPFGELPGAAVFPPFRSSGEEDLSELVTTNVYLNSNATATPAPDPGALTRVWGCGTSPVVACGGSGAYYLDRVSPGLWRLQLYPDLFVVADPYSGTGETKVCLLPGPVGLTVRLPDLGESFAVQAFDGQAAGDRLMRAERGAVALAPGDYLLTRSRWRPSTARQRLAAEVAPRFCGAVRRRAGRASRAGRGSEPVAGGLSCDAPRRGGFGHERDRPVASASGTVVSLAMRPAGAARSRQRCPARRFFLACGAFPFVRRAPPGRPLCRMSGRWTPDGRMRLGRLCRFGDTRPGRCGAWAGGGAPRRAGCGGPRVGGRAPGARAVRLRVEGAGEEAVSGFTLPFVTPDRGWMRRAGACASLPAQATRARRSNLASACATGRGSAAT
jgi:hypothetical protein